MRFDIIDRLFKMFLNRDVPKIRDYPNLRIIGSHVLKRSKPVNIQPSHLPHGSGLLG